MVQVHAILPGSAHTSSAHSCEESAHNEEHIGSIMIKALSGCSQGALYMLYCYILVVSIASLGQDGAVIPCATTGGSRALRWRLN